MNPPTDKSDIPTMTLLYNPTLAAIRDLGGSATISEIEAHVMENMGLSDDILSVTNVSSGQSTFYNRLGWARTDLRIVGLLENTGTGTWALTALGQNTESVDPTRLRRQAVEKLRFQQPKVSDTPDVNEDESEPYGSELTWRDQLLEMLKEMSPSAFERLCQRLLREAGFTDVNVTGRSGDGGIDGNGILQLQGIISVPVSFQSKRYKGSVGAPIVREFRGSLGRQAERGLLMTTGTFTPDARREATREGAVFIDLIDGDGLLDRLKGLRLGVKVEMVEQTTVDSEWWQSTYGVSPTETD